MVRTLFKKRVGQFDLPSFAVNELTQKSWTLLKALTTRSIMENKKCHYHHFAKERKQAFAYLREGKTIKETAKLCDVHPSTIKNWKRSYALRGKDYLKATKAPYSIVNNGQN